MIKRKEEVLHLLTLWFIQCIKWDKHVTFKLNIDRCSKGNSGGAGGGGISRDDKENLVLAYTEFYGKCSNNMTQAKTLLKRVQWCMDNGYIEVMVDSDSMIIIGMINGSIAASWQIKHIIKRINELKMQGDFSFRYFFREVIKCYSGLFG